MRGIKTRVDSLPDAEPSVFDQRHPDATFDGSSRDDYKWGTDGHDVMYGDGGTDVLFTGSPTAYDDTYVGIDRLYGGAGDDSLIASASSNTSLFAPATLLDGGSGDDTLWILPKVHGLFELLGGDGIDTFLIEGGDIVGLEGGSGADVFQFTSTFAGKANIADFQYGDQLIVDGAVSTRYHSNSNGVVEKVVITNAAGGEIQFDALPPRWVDTHLSAGSVGALAFDPWA